MPVRRVTGAAHVDDVRAGAAFSIDHLGFRPAMVEDHIATLRHVDADFEPALLPGAPQAAGVIIALEVPDVRAEADRPPRPVARRAARPTG